MKLEGLFQPEIKDRKSEHQKNQQGVPVTRKAIELLLTGRLPACIRYYQIKKKIRSEKRPTRQLKEHTSNKRVEERYHWSPIW